MFVEEYMTADPVTVREDAALRDAAQLMRQHQFRHLPVLDDAGRLIGIVTDRDIRQTVGFGEPLLENLGVADVMTADPITIPVSATLDHAVQILSKHRFGALPVLNRKRLVGIITYVDVLQALAHVFGLDQEGHRIEVALPEGFSDVARAFQSLAGCNGSLLAAVVSRTRRDGGEPALYLRVKRDQGKHIERRLREATMVLLRPEVQ
ncbi:MAG: CBS domain-containing protein [Planctomycetota bacterium]